MSNPMECSEVRERLALLPGGELEAPQAEAVEAHLVRCAACAGELERLRAALAALGGLDAGDALPIDVWPDVRRQLVAEGLIRAPQTQPAPVVVRRAGARTLWPWVAAAAAAVALAWVGWRRLGPRDRVELQPDPTPRGENLVVQQVPQNPTLPAELAVEEPANAGRLRRADGEGRLREFAVPYEWVQGRGGAYSLAGDRELR